MAVGGSNAQGNSSQTERRRERRLTLVIHLDVEWYEPDGSRVKERARARNMDIHGAFLELKRFPRAKSEIALTNLLSGESARARVNSIRRSAEGKLLGVAVELITPSESFWGLTFQLQRTTLRLLEIERAFQAGSHEIDGRVLRELRVAVEDLNTTAAAIRQWQDLQEENRDAYSVIPNLAAARVARVIYLLNELAADLDAGELTFDDEGIHHFAHALERIYKRMNPDGESVEQVRGPGSEAPVLKTR